MKSLLLVLSLLFSVAASAVTASLDYVDRRDDETLAEANAYTDAHSGGVDTNAVIKIVSDAIKTNATLHGYSPMLVPCEIVPGDGVTFNPSTGYYMSGAVSGRVYTVTVTTAADKPIIALTCDETGIDDVPDDPVHGRIGYVITNHMAVISMWTNGHGTLGVRNIRTYSTKQGGEPPLNDLADTDYRLKDALGEYDLSGLRKWTKARIAALPRVETWAAYSATSGVKLAGHPVVFDRDNTYWAGLVESNRLGLVAGGFRFAEVDLGVNEVISEALRLTNMVVTGIVDRVVIMDYVCDVDGFDSAALEVLACDDINHRAWRILETGVERQGEHRLVVHVGQARQMFYRLRYGAELSNALILTLRGQINIEGDIGLNGTNLMHAVAAEMVDATNATWIATTNYVTAATNSISLTPGPQGPQGEPGEVDPVELTNAVCAVTMPAVSSVTSAVPARLPAATIAAFNAALATNGIAALTADATLYDALDRLMQMASRSAPGPVPPEVDPVVVRLDGVVEYYEIGSGADVETVFVYGGLTGEFAVITNPAAVTADILVCGGGGGGGAECSGGGGGGHVVAVTNAALVAASYAIQVGAGGNYQGGGWSGNSAAGANGGNSSLVGGEIALAAQGGGGGGGATKAASYYTGLLNGGGLGCNNQSPSAAPVRSGGAGTTSPYGSGGGGASDLGNGYAANDGQHLGWGCEGVTSDITGVAQVYGSGGGGGRGHEKNALPPALDPGKGGTNAGHGNYANSRENCAAPAGFGGGGGGGSVAGTSEYRNGGNGGSGTVIIRVKGKCTVLPDESAAPEGEED